MRKFVLAGLASIGLLASVPAAAITFGTPDGNKHPHVGTLLFKTASGYYSCTGTLLSPTVMLTAGHCTEEAGVPNLKTWVSFAPQINVRTGCGTAKDVEKCIDQWFDKPSNGWIKATATPHPAYDDFAQWPATFDIGVLELATAVNLPVYGTLPPLGFLETVKAKSDSFTVVGYGQQGEIKPFFSNIWERYAGTVKLVELNSTYNGGMSAKFSNNAGTGGGTCFGDSGGPVFYGNTNIVVSVVSWGLTPCIGVSYEFRTDIPLAQDFLADYL